MSDKINPSKEVEEKNRKNSTTNLRKMRYINHRQKSKRTKRDSKGGIFIGNLPHGFYEKELRGFLSQFGKITRIRIARSRKNAAPMGYGFVEFENAEVAQIVANTMHNYLMFDKLLKCHLIAGKNLSRKMFRNTNTNLFLCEGTIKKKLNHYMLSKNKGKEFLLKRQKRLSKQLNFVKTLGIQPVTTTDNNFAITEVKEQTPSKVENIPSHWNVSPIAKSDEKQSLEEQKSSKLKTKKSRKSSEIKEICDGDEIKKSTQIQTKSDTEVRSGKKKPNAAIKKSRKISEIKEICDGDLIKKSTQIQTKSDTEVRSGKRKPNAAINKVIGDKTAKAEKEKGEKTGSGKVAKRKAVKSDGDKTKSCVKKTKSEESVWIKEAPRKRLRSATRQALSPSKSPKLKDADAAGTDSVSTKNPRNAKEGRKKIKKTKSASSEGGQKVFTIDDINEKVIVKKPKNVLKPIKKMVEKEMCNDESSSVKKSTKSKKIAKSFSDPKGKRNFEKKVLQKKMKIKQSPSTNLESSVKTRKMRTRNKKSLVL